MDNLGILKGKLEAFIRRFYINELLKGLIFFIAIGLVYFLLTLFIESILWLDSVGRSILFWSFVGVEFLLLCRFVMLPLLKLFRISKGITYEQASRIIGEHFPEVSDKLLNLLQLSRNNRKSELLMAGIDQKAAELSPVPFSLAVDFRKSLRFVKYAAVPVLFLVFIFLTGNSAVFSNSYKRVVNYKVAYEPPAPFSFHMMNDELKVREGEKLKIQVRTTGKVIPENASIYYEGQVFFLEQKSPGEFEYVFEPATEDFDFFLTANKVNSKSYSVDVIKVPRMKNLRMSLNFPAYTGYEPKVLEGTGNATIPEGTIVKWELETASTREVEMLLDRDSVLFEKEGGLFFKEKEILDDLSYVITTSNEEMRHYERLDYRLEVVGDEYPEIRLEQKADSLDMRIQHFYGKASDDYGISAIKLVYYLADSEDDKRKVQLLQPRSNIAEFFSSFPDTLTLEKGKDYSYYFEVTDNDGVNGRKSTRSKTFSYRSLTEEEKKDLRLQEKSKTIQGMDQGLEEFRKSERDLEELRRLQKEKKELSYNDRQRLENFLNRQKQQNKLMKSFNEKLKKNLEEEKQPETENLKKELQKRVESREKALKENEELLKELEEYSDKIREEDLSRKLEEFSRKSRSQERNLEQLLELTKRYYVQEKVQKLSRDLQKLGDEQEKLSEAGEKNTKAAQDALSEKTNEKLSELEEVVEENQGLKKPMSLETGNEEKEEIKREQKEAGQKLEQGNKPGAKEEQKKASEQLRKLSSKMQRNMQSGGMEQMQEDSEMLRQILDNLITFSFEQEELMEQFRNSTGGSSGFASKLRRQDVLREHFQHIDDSLYALGLRNAMIGEIITTKLVDVDYSLDQALKRLAENQIHQGIGSQQYVVTGANDLAYLLSDILGNMQQMMSQASGSGKGKGMQLPDIIKKQEELSEQLKEGLQKQQGQGQKEGEKRGEGERDSEETSGELFRIFQEQQMLRRALEEKLKEQGSSGTAEGLQKEMKEIENRILEKGFDRQTYDRMRQLEHKLLELQEAKLEQGRKAERESETNLEGFSNEVRETNIKAKEYFKTTEILNRQSLPLRQIYKKKVKEYFERTND